MTQKHRIYTMSFASVYVLYLAKVERKGRSKAEVDEIILWLTGYSQAQLIAHLAAKTDFESFFAEAPALNPARTQITGLICGVRIEAIEDPLMREIRYLDKLIDELAKGRPMQKILRAAVALAVAALALVLSPPAKAQTAEAPASCAPSGGYSFICGLTNVEDIVQIPGTRWLIGSSMRLGQASVPGSGAALYLIDSDAKTARAAPIVIEPDKDGPISGCAPLDPTRPGTHGLELREGAEGWGGGVHTLYAINHGGREAIEVFRLDARTPNPVITWIGCIPTPANAWANSVAALPDGALAISKYANLEGLTAGPVFRGEITGVVYIWKPGSGFSELEGSKLSGNNGLIASKDGKRLWVADQGRRQIVRFALDGAAPPAYAKLDFNPDNLRWAPDGSILAAGQIIAPAAALAGANAWGVARLNPDTLAVTPMITEPGAPQFANGTVALQLGQTLWFGTFRGDRLAYAPLR